MAISGNMSGRERAGICRHQRPPQVGCGNCKILIILRISLHFFKYTYLVDIVYKVYILRHYYYIKLFFHIFLFWKNLHNKPDMVA